MVAGAFVDLDGTVYRGRRTVPGAADGIRSLRDRGITVYFLSNKPIDRREEYAEKLTDLGIPADASEVLTSASVTGEFLASTYPDARPLVVGEEALVRELEDAGLRPTDDPDEAGVVVASMDREFTYEKLHRAMDAIDGGALFVATNPDRTCPVESGEIPDAAGMIGAIRGVTDADLDHLVGKPSEIMLEAALERLGHAAEDCLLIGDRLETDIAMGERAGMTTVLVRTGVTDDRALAASEHEPDHVIESLGEIEGVLSSIDE